MQVQEALDKFLLQLEADGRSTHTIRQYRRHVLLLSRWVEQYGHTGEIEHVDHEVLARFLSGPDARTRPDGRKKKAGSMNALRSSVRVFFGYLHQAGFVTQNPARLVRRAICGTPPPRSLSESDQGRLLRMMVAGEKPADRRDHALFHLMLSTGIRLGSALGLDVEDVDLDQGEILLRVTKGDRTERVILGRAIRAALRVYIERRPSGPLFRSHGNRRLSQRQAQKRFSMWLEMAGVRQPASTHSLRHSFATDLYRRTGDIFLVQQALRHRSISSTVVYAQCCDERLRDVLGA